MTLSSRDHALYALKDTHDRAKREKMGNFEVVRLGWTELAVSLERVRLRLAEAGIKMEINDHTVDLCSDDRNAHVVITRYGERVYVWSNTWLWNRTFSHKRFRNDLQTTVDKIITVALWRLF